MRVIGLDESSGSQHQNPTVELGKKAFHSYPLPSMCTVNHDLLLAGEAHSAPSYTTLKRAPKRHSLSAVSLEKKVSFLLA